MGEIEAVFGIWAIPLALLMWADKGADVTRHYLDQDVSYVEPLFVVVIMAIAASRPIVQAAVRVLGLVAGQSPARWWLVLLTIGPLLGSFITEPAAMTICAVLLGREFYRLNPSPRFMYATLGLLFVNVSVGGALTSFAAPPVLIVAGKWGWDTTFMVTHFGFRALAGILVGSGAYFVIFRKEFSRMAETRRDLPPDEASHQEPVPLWITAVHLAFLVWTVIVAHEPALFIGGFLFFLGFTLATTAYQDEIDMRSPMLVGFFLAGLVIHGGLQGWWIEPVLSRLGEYPAAGRRDRADRLQRQRGHHLSCHTRAGFQRHAQGRRRLRRHRGRGPDRHRQRAEPRGAVAAAKIFSQRRHRPGQSFSRRACRRRW